MNIRVYHKDGTTRDLTVSDGLTEIQQIVVAGQRINTAYDAGGEPAYRRTDEVEDGRVVFR